MPKIKTLTPKSPRSQATINCLITGFDPFFGQPYNPSEVIAQSMPPELALSVGQVSINSLTLPTIGNGCWQVLAPVLKRLTANKSPFLLVMLGLASKRKSICLERFALNISDYVHPDNKNKIVQNEKISQSAPEAYRTNAPIESALTYVNKNGWPAEISNNAGTFICNEIYFRAMEYFESNYKQSKSPYIVSFIHLPLPQTYGKTLKEKGSNKTKTLAKGKDNQMRAMLEAIKLLTIYNCEFLAKQNKK